MSPNQNYYLDTCPCYSAGQYDLLSWTDWSSGCFQCYSLQTKCQCYKCMPIDKYDYTLSNCKPEQLKGYFQFLSKGEHLYTVADRDTAAATASATAIFSPRSGNVFPLGGNVAPLNLSVAATATAIVHPLPPPPIYCTRLPPPLLFSA